MTKISDTLINLVRFRVGSFIDIKKIDIFSIEDIQNALELSLRAFNMYPVITYFKWDDVETIDMISDLLVTYAAYLLFDKASIQERGREYAVNNDGVNFIPPQISDMAFNISNQAYDNWLTQIDALKTSETFLEDFVEDSSDGDSYDN
jgi:hypothetical protein